MNIILNPTESMIDLDLEKSEGIMIFSNAKSLKEFREYLERLFNWKRNVITYIHYYSKDNKYTVGFNKIE